MNILMISDVYHPRVNGVSTSIATFRRELHDLGLAVCLVAPEYGGCDGDDGDIMRIPSRYVFVDPEDRMMKQRGIAALEDELHARSFDLVHVQTPFIAHRAGVRLARRLQLPVVETYHTYFEEYLHHYVPFLPGGLVKSASRWFTRRQCNNVDAVIVPSRAMCDVLVEYGVKTPVSIIPTGIEEDEFLAGSGERFRRENNIGPDRPVLVHIGRVAHEKNIGFLLEVIAELRRHVPDVLLVIAGEGPAERALRRMTCRLDIHHNVKFVGYLPRGPRLCDCYCAGEAFVFASSTETQGLVLLEAMALGVPVVSTAVMGTRDILHKGRGALVADGAVDDFTGKLLRLLRDDDLRLRLGREAVEYARQWSAQKMAVRLVGFYAGVLQAERAPSSAQAGDASATG